MGMASKSNSENSTKNRTDNSFGFEELLPRQIVEELDRYIIGQNEAKRAVAVALRNRYRRERMPEELRNEVTPKNIMMIGPTGVGKTEIARRLAKLTKAPFIKVEATKYTEVGYVGRDLADIAVHMVTEEHKGKVKAKADRAALKRVASQLYDMLNDDSTSAEERKSILIACGVIKAADIGSGDESVIDLKCKDRRLITSLKKALKEGKCADVLIDVEISENTYASDVQIVSNSGTEELGINFSEIMGDLLPKRKKVSKMCVADALEVIQNEEANNMIDAERVKREAIKRAESRGIVFLDEIDKIVGSHGSDNNHDVSREGVQRDILPIIEGSAVSTKYGTVHTEHILFIAAGAFHEAKPSELMPELQGRFPIRVNLSSLEEEDLQRILTEPKNSLTRQYSALLAVEGIELVFKDDGVEEMARMAAEVNAQTENIGARRLYTIMERVLDSVSFAASELENKRVIIDREFVKQQLKEVVERRDLSKFIL